MIRLMFFLAWLCMCVATWPASAAPPRNVERNFPLLSDEECWARMPQAEKGRGEPLPSWARALASPLPRTTAAMLRLDWVHRTRSPLEPSLRGRMRWVAAHANHCAYAQSYAIFDLRRAGLGDDQLEPLQRCDWSRCSAAERAALEFARKMSLDSASVTDAEFATLLALHGEKNVAAMVVLLACANFQDRLFLSLGSALENNEPRGPVEVAFVRGSLNTRPGAKPPMSSAPLRTQTDAEAVEVDSGWADVSYDELQARLENQRRKTARIRVPTPRELEAAKPPGYTARQRPSQWSLVCFGYVPELAEAWSTSMATFFAEAKLDMVFEEGIFWVVTRATDCSYCMGHVEMGWELAGLTPSDIAVRARMLAGNNWSGFPSHEQKAYAFARKLTRAPWTVTTEEIEALKRDFGPERAAVVAWAAARCNYMIRVSNGFQLGLERGNIFRDYFQNAPK